MEKRVPELKPQGKEPKTPGPEPEILKIDMEWKEAIKKFIGETEANGWLAKIAHSTPPKLAAFMCIPPLRKVHTSERILESSHIEAVLGLGRALTLVMADAVPGDGRHCGP